MPCVISAKDRTSRPSGRIRNDQRTPPNASALGADVCHMGVLGLWRSVPAGRGRQGGAPSGTHGRVEVARGPPRPVLPPCEVVREDGVHAARRVAAFLMV